MGDNQKNVKMGWCHLKIFSTTTGTVFNQTWHKSSFGVGDSSFLHEGDSPSPRRDNSKRVKTN
jgi:hypothetical protein